MADVEPSAEFYVHITDTGLIDPKDDRLGKILGWDNYDIFRQPLSFLFPADAHDRIDRLFTSGKNLEGILFPRVPLRYKPSGYINFDMTVTSAGNGTWHLDFFKVGKGVLSDQEEKEVTDMYTFFNFVESVLDSPYEGDLDVTMISVEGLKDDSGLSNEERSKVRAKVESQLKDIAIGGQIGQLDDASYGLLTGGDFDEESFEKELQTAAEKLNISPNKLGLRSANIEVDDRAMDPEDLKKALNQSKSAFLGEIDSDDVGGKLSVIVSGIEHHISLIKEALNTYQYRTSQRSIRDTKNGALHAVLHQGRVGIDERFRFPDELIVMTDHADLAYEHDMTQLDEMLRLIAFNAKGRDEVLGTIYYEFCRSTILGSNFINDVQACLAKHKIQSSVLGIRLRGMPPLKRGGLHWQQVDKLCEAGHPMWLDRFGDAIIDDHLADILVGGVIEIPPALIRKLSRHFDGKELMAKLVSTWGARKVAVVSADIEEIKLKEVANEIGIALQLEAV